jgi:hypothetical protein
MLKKLTACPGCGATPPLPHFANTCARNGITKVCDKCHARLLEAGERGVHFETGLTLRATGNDLEVQRIMKLDEGALLDYVMANPEYLCDGYYRVFGDAMEARYQQLRKVPEGPRDQGPGAR